MGRFDLSDFEWSVIEPLLPTKVRGVPRVDDWRVLNGIFWRLRTGTSWADIPSRYGPHTTCVNRFNRWRKAGHWARILQAVSAAYEGYIQMIDNFSIRVRQHAAYAEKRCQIPLHGSLARRPDDQNSCPGRCARPADRAQADRRASARRSWRGRCAARRPRLRQRRNARGLGRTRSVGLHQAVPNRKRILAFSPFLCRFRNLGERFFSKLKHFRAVANRYDKRADNFLASVQLASIRIWSRHNQSVT